MKNIQPIENYPHYRKKEKSIFSNLLFDENYIFQEPPQLVNDGTNKKYKLSKKIVDGTEMVFKNGMLMRKGITDDYTLSNENIIFNEIPASNSIIVVNYKHE